MSSTLPPLTLRAEKGSALTSAEGDKDFTILRDGINGLFALLAVALNSDGTVKTNAVSTLALIDRAVTNAKLAFDSSFYVADTSVSANTITVTFSPAPSAYAAGMVFYILVANANTGAVTINANALGAKTLKKNGNVDLVSGDLKAGQLICVAYDAVAGTPVFQLVNTIPQVNTPWCTGVVSQQAGSLTTALTASYVEIATIALTLPAGKSWVWVKVVFSGIVPTGQMGIQFETAPVRHNGTSLSLVNNAPPGGIATGNSDDSAAFTMVAEGVPTGYETANLDLEIRCKYPAAAVGNGGDTPASRACYAVGWYTNA